MYKVELTNEYGAVRIGTEEDARLTSLLGIGLPAKSVTDIEFFGGAGVYETSKRDNPRTITLKGEFYGNRDEINRMYKVIYHDCDIKFTFGNERRKIRGKCINPEDFIREGAGITSFIMQFECDNPYFEDFMKTNISILKRVNYLPNYYDEETDKWYIKLPVVATERYSEGDVINLGHIEVYPVIKIINSGEETIAGTQLDIYNQTSDVHIKLNYDIEAEETITINLPEREIISSVNGEITHYISDDTVLSDFKLALGNNHILVTSTQSVSYLTCSVEYSNNYAWAVL